MREPRPARQRGPRLQRGCCYQSPLLFLKASAAILTPEGCKGTKVTAHQV